MNKKNIFIFVLILLVGMTAVSAADIADDDTTTAATIETPQVEQTNTEPITQQEVQEVKKEKTLKEDSNDELPVPRVIDSDLTIDDDNYNDYNNVNWTVYEGVTITGTGYAFTNVAINILGDYVTLDHITITSINNTKLIDATDKKNLTITDSSLTLINTGTSGNNQAIGIDLTNTANVTISGTTLQVQAPSQAQTWKNDTGYWYSVLDVSGILVNNANNITIDQNTIHIQNTTEKYAYTTMPAITIKNGTNNINVTFNEIQSTGAHFVYGIMMNDGVTNASIKNNSVLVQDKLYVAGIDTSTATNSVVSGNTINAQSSGQTTYDPEVGEESLAYGIISDTYDMGNQNNRICKNNIYIMANVKYGIEVYKGNNITVCSNVINGNANGNKAMGVAFAHTNNSKVINNNISVTGTTGSYHPFYEEIAPVNTGIIFTNQSNNNHIQGNEIRVTAIGDTAARSVNITNDTDNTIIHNQLEYQVTTDGIGVGTGTAIVDSGNSLSHGVTVVLYECDCGCMSTTPQNLEITEIESTSTKKSLKQDLPDGLPDDVIIINDENVAYYCNLDPSFLQYFQNYPISVMMRLKNSKFITNISDSKPINLGGNVRNNATFLGDYSGIAKNYTIDGSTELDNFYGPKAQFSSIKSITNSVVGRVSATELTENCTIINYEGNVGCDFNSATFKNNYIVSIKGDNVTFPKTLFATIYHNVENNTPNYDPGIALTNSNYNTYFDEANTLKEAYENSVLFAIEQITNPVIINKNVTLSALRDIGGYDNVTFIEGSDNSLVEDATINKITLNGVNNIIINHNRLLSEDSSIDLIGSINCIIENNTINTQLTNTINADEDSFNNEIKYNELYSAGYNGDKSVNADKEQNTIELNAPIPVPTLKINTYEFTVGTVANISASIILDDDVATNINKGKVVFKVNGKTLKDSTGKVIYANIINGTATITNYKIPQSWAKNAIITATYAGSTQCEKLTNETEIIITPPEPTITTEDITTTANAQITITATIADGDKQIDSGKVVFKINGKTVKDENGKVIYAQVTNGIATITDYTIPATFKSGTYIITAIFTSPNYDEKLQTNSTLTINA